MAAGDYVVCRSKNIDTTPNYGLSQKMAKNGNLHSCLRNDIKEATLNYRISQMMAGGGMYTHALRPKTTVLPVSIVVALLKSDIRNDIDKACFRLRHGWGWGSQSH